MNEENEKQIDKLEAGENIPSDKRTFMEGLHHDLANVSLLKPIIRHFSGYGEKDDGMNFQGLSFEKLKYCGLFKEIVRVNSSYSLQSSPNLKETNFLIKYWHDVDTGKVPGGFMRRETFPWKREYKQYQFLRGIPNVPQVYRIEDILKEQDGFRNEENPEEFASKLCVLSWALLIENLGNKTFEDFLKNHEHDKKRRFSGIKRVLESLVNFQFAATQKYHASKQNGISLEEELISQRDPLIRAVDYTRAFIGKFSIDDIPSDEKLKIEEGYHLIKERYQDPGFAGIMVCHGDFTPSNIVEGKKPEDSKKFIDPKLVLRDGMFDVARIVASPGVNLSPEEWNKIAVYFRILQLRKAGGMVRGINKQQEANSRRALYDMIIDNSFRTASRIIDTQNFFPEIYEKMCLAKPFFKEALQRMKYNIRQATRNMLKSPDFFGIANVDEYKNLRENLYKIGAINGNGKGVKEDKVPLG